MTSRGTAGVQSEFLVTRPFRQGSNTASTPKHHCAFPFGPLGARRSVCAWEIALTLSSPPKEAARMSTEDSRDTP